MQHTETQPGTYRKKTQLIQFLILESCPSAIQLQSTALGLAIHPFLSFDDKRTMEILHIPEDYTPQNMNAIGQADRIEVVSAHNLAREYPSQRRALDESVRKGSF